MAKLAYEKAVKETAQAEMLEQSQMPPPVPPKDYRTDRIYNPFTFAPLTIDTDSWAPITYSIPEDSILPTGGCHLGGWPAE